MSEEFKENILNINFEKVMNKKYLDYAMSVIVDRALPDIRDGLKPVHRRIIFAMNQLNNYSNTPYKKSARIVGDVIGKYHPHGDSSVYDAMVRMAQDFSMRVPLVDGQGNFGSVDGDSPAAMRYTESRMSVFAEMMLKDINKETVRFVDNYDGTEKIPMVLPATFPNLLVNGSQGIAVGMASNIPPHNPIEVLDCVLKAIEENGEINEENLEEYMKILPAPDFPTGGIVHDLSDMENVWRYGFGRVQIRSKWHEETSDNGKKMIVVTEIPYQVNKKRLLEKISDAVNQDEHKNVQVDGVYDFRDESDKDGMRICIEIKGDFEPEVVFNHLAKKVDFNKSFNYNNTVLVNNHPQQVGLIKVFNEFIKFRIDVVTKRTEYLDRLAKEKQHILDGFIKALASTNVEKVISTIRGSKSNKEALNSLKDLLDLDDIQAQAILDMKLQKLTSEQVDELKLQHEKLLNDRKFYANILSSKEETLKVIKEETELTRESFEKAKHKNTKQKIYGVRLTDYRHDEIVLDLASLIKEEECSILLTKEGYVRRVSLEEMEQQNRGTRGKKKIELRDTDHIIQSLNSHSHDLLMGFTNTGKVFALKAFEISDKMKGKFINTLANISNEEKVIMLLPIEKFDVNKSLVFFTKSGKIKRTRLDNYTSATRKGGVIGINLKEEDEVIKVAIAEENDEIVMLNKENKITRFDLNKVRFLSRNSMGITGMKIDNEENHVIGADVISQINQGTLYIITISENGLVKITDLEQYKKTNRGSKGYFAMKVTERTGNLFNAMVVSELDGEIVTTTEKGYVNRIAINSINVTNRTTSGVKLISIDDDDKLADVYHLDRIEEEIIEVELEKENLLTKEEE